MSTHLPVLGSLSPDDFLTQYWQREPLVVRGALESTPSDITIEDIAGLALEPEVESRLVVHRDQREWVLEHGPMTREQLSTLPEQDWTLLVQAADLWLPEIGRLRERFDFLPRWRFDDIMVSIADPGGSVGPHFDQYDVFLIQIEGEREWRLGARCPLHTPFTDHPELKLLETFDEQKRFTLGPGDMLYVPPQVAHWGIATTRCMTYSVGFRAPSAAELLADLADRLQWQPAATIADPELSRADANDIVPEAYLERVRSELLAVLDDRSTLEAVVGSYLTQPKYPDLVELTAERRVAQVGDRRFVNGEEVSAPDD